MAQSRIPSLNWLRVFEAAARCENFARAADELGMSAAAVSQQIKALETSVGTPLFRRTPKSVQLTDVGRAYLPKIRMSLLGLEEATVGLFGQASQQSLFVQSVLIFAQGILAPSIGDFLKQNSNLNLVMTTANNVSDFQNGMVDLSIIFGSSHFPDRNSEVILEETLYPVACPEICCDISNPQDLLKYPLIEIADHAAGWGLVCETLKLGHGSRHTIFADSTPMALSLAQSGVGIALARAPASDALMAHTGLRPCLPDVQIAGLEKYHLVYRDKALLKKPAKDFRNWLLDHLSDRNR